MLLLRLAVDESSLLLSFTNLLHKVTAKRMQMFVVVRQLHFIIVGAQGNDLTTFIFDARFEMCGFIVINIHREVYVVV